MSDRRDRLNVFLSLSKASASTGGDGVVLPKCSFSVHLHVSAKHFDGVGSLTQYDYDETASFALETVT